MTEPDGPEARAAGGLFQRDVSRMLLTFFAVIAIDVVVISLVTGKLRFWFPVWIDPEWETRPDAWVIYSQSYLAGVFLIPVLARAVDRDFLWRFGVGARLVGWATAVALLGFIGWWKGGLMIRHGKQREALAWLALAAITWAVVSVAQAMPGWLSGVGRRALFARLLDGLAAFFLVMALADPVLQLLVQRLGWSSGLIIEVVFFVPAGVACLAAARRLRRPEEQTPSESPDRAGETPR